jgi:hypothetical protein
LRDCESGGSDDGTFCRKDSPTHTVEMSAAGEVSDSQSASGCFLQPAHTSPAVMRATERAIGELLFVGAAE